METPKKIVEIKWKKILKRNDERCESGGEGPEEGCWDKVMNLVLFLFPDCVAHTVVPRAASFYPPCFYLQKWQKQ